MRKLFFIGLIFLYLPSIAQNVRDTVARKIIHNISRQAILPSSLLIYGFISLDSKPLKQFDRYVNGSMLNKPSFSNIDDYLRYAPIAAVYGLNAVHLPGKNNFIDRTLVLVLSTAIASSSVTLTKRWTQRLRPDKSNAHSFPSGHTATAFMSAEFMRQEYGDESVWFSVGGYATATLTGAIRLFRHAHWFSDVVAAAGYGIISTKLAYLIYPYLKDIFTSGKSGRLLIIPAIQEDYKGLSLSCSFP